MRAGRQPMAGWWPVAAIALLLALAAAAAAYSAPQLDRLPMITETEAPAATADRATEPVPSAQAEPVETGKVGLPGWVSTVVGGLCVAVVVAVVVLFAWFMLRRNDSIGRAAPIAPSAGDRGESSAKDVVAALDAGLLDLSDSDADARRAVIACWLRLEEVAAAAGTPRRVSDTPTDLVTRLLSAAGDGSARPVSGVVLTGFAEVYRQARYAAHPVDERMRAQARTALARLRAELSGADLPGGAAAVPAARPTPGSPR